MYQPTPAWRNDGQQAAQMMSKARLVEDEGQVVTGYDGARMTRTGERTR